MAQANKFLDASGFATYREIYVIDNLLKAEEDDIQACNDDINAAEALQQKLLSNVNCAQGFVHAVDRPLHLQDENRHSQMSGKIHDSKLPQPSQNEIHRNQIRNNRSYRLNDAKIPQLEQSEAQYKQIDGHNRVHDGNIPQHMYPHAQSEVQHKQEN